MLIQPRARFGLFLAMALLVTACDSGAPPSGAFDVETVVAGGSPFHGVHGMRFDDNDELYAVSVIGQSVFRVDTSTGEIETIVGPPQGMADDIAIRSDGTMVWTAIEDGVVYVREPTGEIRRLWEDQRGVNAVTFSPDEERLFVSLVFYGDAVYELDIDGNEPPRLIREGMGGLNAFEVNENGLIYGPLVFGAAVVSIDIETGEMSTISDDFESAGALKLESPTSALVLDRGLVLKRVNLVSGETTTVASLPAGADNLAIDSTGRVFVSLSEVNAIVEVDVDDGSYRYVVEPAPLTSATGLAVIEAGGREELLIGDLFGGVKRIDVASGSIEETPVDIFQPAHLSASDTAVLVVSEVFGAIQMLDAESFDVIAAWQGLDRLGDAIFVGDEVVVAETGGGRVIRLDPDDTEERTVVADGLAGPIGLAPAGSASVYVTERDGGRLLRLDLIDGVIEELASGLAQPEGITVDGEGAIYVVEVAASRVSQFDALAGTRLAVAEDLPIGLSNGPSLYRDIEAGRDVLYLNSDVDNSVLRLVPR